jgi:hypothetical protein
MECGNAPIPGLAKNSPIKFLCQYLLGFKSIGTFIQQQVH